MNEYYKTAFDKKYSVSLFADAAFRAGVAFSVAPPGISPLDRNTRLAGPAITVEANNDLVSVLAALHRAKKGQVLVIANPHPEAAVIGDLIAAEATRRGLAGIVTDGKVRDTQELREMGLPVFCRGAYPIGPLKLPESLKGIGGTDQDLDLGDCIVSPGDWAFGDSDGLIFLDSEHLPVVFEQAAESWKREDALLQDIRSGKALTDLLKVGTFVEKRLANPSADFNAHLREIGRAI